MKVSVIIPVYNVERYLRRCLDSVVVAAEKANCEVEILCVNDGSTDGSLAVLEQALGDYQAQAHVKLVIFTKENGGAGPARNLALDHATGDWVMFLDSDDFIPHDALAKFLYVAQASGASVIASQTFVRDCDYRPEARSATCAWTLKPAAWIAGQRHMQYSIWNKLIRAEVMRNRRFLPAIFEDFAFTIELFSDLDTFALLREAQYVYCVNNEGSSVVRSPFSHKKVSESLRMIRHVMEYARGRAAETFAIRQAAGGMAMMINKVFKTQERALWRELVGGYTALAQDFPLMAHYFPLKTRFRLWWMRRCCA